jgi:RimJ/RimL family protein N-acetyltransferase
MEIQFQKVTPSHLNIIFQWLEQDFILEFWDNTQAHKDNIANFANGRKTLSPYVDGKYIYWIATIKDEPFAMLMSIQNTFKDDIEEEKLDRLSRTGNTYNIDFMIGNPSFFGKGYGARTLNDFIHYFRKNIDFKADTFMIDPPCNNARAKHVYMKAGFEYICDFKMSGDCSGANKFHHLLIKKFEPNLAIIEACIDDYPCIQNMARFYVYDVSRECGHISSDWAIPADGLYESFDFKSYFENSNKKAYLVKVYDEIAGFVLLSHKTQDNITS